MRISLRILSHVAFAILLLAGRTTANAQETENREVVVQAEGEELPTAYGAPPDMSHGRISTLTKSYVLSPFSFELEAGYEGAAFRHGLPSHLFRQEIEMDCPRVSLLACKIRLSISLEKLATAASRWKRAMRWRTGTSFRSTPLSPPSIDLVLAMHCLFPAKSLFSSRTTFRI